MTRIALSPQETRVLGLRVGHCTTAEPDAAALRARMLADRFDLVRLKVRTDVCRDAGVPALEALGVPYFHAGGLLRYQRDYRARPYARRYPRPPDLGFEPVPASAAETLAGAVRACFADDPIGYYKTPYLSALFDRAAEVECLVEFYLRHEPPGRLRVRVRAGGEEVGFIVMTETDGTLHTDLLGILPGARSRGLFDPMRDYIHLHASERGLREEEGARYDNVQSQNVFEADGLEHFANESIFHVTPFLERSAIEPFVAGGQWEIELARRVDLSGLRAVRRQGALDRLGAETRVRVPVHTPELVVAVAEGATSELAYAEYRRG